MLGTSLPGHPMVLWIVLSSSRGSAVMSRPNSSCAVAFWEIVKMDIKYLNQIGFDLFLSSRAWFRPPVEDMVVEESQSSSDISRPDRSGRYAVTSFSHHILSDSIVFFVNLSANRISRRVAASKKEKIRSMFLESIANSLLGLTLFCNILLEHSDSSILIYY